MYAADCFAIEWAAIIDVHLAWIPIQLQLPYFHVLCVQTMPDNLVAQTNVDASRRIRSFVQRSRRMTPAQQQAFEQQWDRYGLQLDTGLLKLHQVFGNDHPVILEIGFGMGDSLIAMASVMTQYNFLGVEVHKPGISRLLNQAAGSDLGNIRIFYDDVVDVLYQGIPNHSLAGVQLFFPDPWHKKRHHKRRLVQAAFVQDIRAKLMRGGSLHMATDWQPYAEHMLRVMEAAEGFTNSQ